MQRRNSKMMRVTAFDGVITLAFVKFPRGMARFDSAAECSLHDSGSRSRSPASHNWGARGGHLWNPF
jgi:hypothetical protein